MHALMKVIRDKTDEIIAKNFDLEIVEFVGGTNLMNELGMSEEQVHDIVVELEKFFELPQRSVNKANLSSVNDIVEYIKRGLHEKVNNI